MIDPHLAPCIERRWPENSDSPLYGRRRTTKSIWQTTFNVRCSGNTHRLRIDRGTLVLRDHPGDLARERTLARIAGNAACFQILDAWEERRAVPLDPLPQELRRAYISMGVETLAGGADLTEPLLGAVEWGVSRHLTTVVGGLRAGPVEMKLDPDPIAPVRLAPLGKNRQLTGTVPGWWVSQLWRRRLGIVGGALVERVLDVSSKGGPELLVVFARVGRHSERKNLTCERQLGVLRRRREGPELTAVEPGDRATRMFQVELPDLHDGWIAG